MNSSCIVNWGQELHWYSLVCLSQYKNTTNSRNVHTITLKHCLSLILLELLQNHRGTPKWLNGQILRQKGPVTYLVRVGPKIRYCHVKHLIWRYPSSRNNQIKTVVNQHDTLDPLWIPDHEGDIPLLPQQDAHMGDSSGITAQPWRSSRPVKPLQCVIEELWTNLNVCWQSSICTYIYGHIATSL